MRGALRGLHVAAAAVSAFLACRGPPAAPRLGPRRRVLGGEGDAFEGAEFGEELASSDAYDVMDDDGWRPEAEEADAGVRIRSDRDGAENPVDVESYFFGDDDDDAELRSLLADLEAEYAARDDEASRSILESVRTCAAVLAEETDAMDYALDARAALAFAATARGDAPSDELRNEAGDLVAVDLELAEAYALVDDEKLDESLDEMRVRPRPLSSPPRCDARP